MRIRRRITASAIITITLVALIAVVAFGQRTGFHPYYLSMVDESGRPFTTSTTVAVYKSASSTSRTVYSDANKTAIGAALTSITNGEIRFWCDLPAVDLTLTYGDVVDRRISVGPNQGPIVMATTRHDTLSITGAAIVLEGATHDAFETTLTVTDPTADRTVTLADASGTVVLSSLATNAAGAANSVTGGTNTLIFEGATGDGTNVTTITPADPSGANAVTLADASGTVMLSALATNAAGVANSVTGASNGLVFEGATGDAYSTTLTPADPGASATVTIPANTGTIPVALAAVGTPSASVATDWTAATVYTLVPDQSCNITATTAPAGTIVAVVVTTSGTSTYTLTFTTNYKTTGTLATGAADGKVFVLTFVSDGTTMHEAARTTAM